MTKFQPKKLIEVAMPIKEISAESVRDGRIQHGHISSLHKWWARRPLPVCRAVVFASLVPDPLDENCPQAFRDAIEILLGKENNPGDPYHPYMDIPWTAVYDPMEDNLRNRLQMFIGKFTDDMQQALLHNKPKPAANKLLSDFSLIKWDNKNNETIINKARKLIFVSHQYTTFSSQLSAVELINDFDELYNAIKKAEQELYSLKDRHLNSEDCKLKTNNLHVAIETFLDKMPKVFDPFAGGGAIPLEAARLGCRSFGNDINPVAHIIQKGSLEFPQKYGKQITYSKTEFLKLYGQEEWNKLKNEDLIFEDGEPVAILIPNQLSFDVDFNAKKILDAANAEIGYIYPENEKGDQPYGYYWSRVGICSNPTCRAEVPLLKQFYLVNTTNKQLHLDPIISGNKIGFKIESGKTNKEGWIKSRLLICPCCGASTDTEELKRQSNNSLFKFKLLAVIDESEHGKTYRLPTDIDINIIETLSRSLEINEEIVKGDSRSLWLTLWGINTWGEMFTVRQINVLNIILTHFNALKLTLDSSQSEYKKAVLTYLAIWIDRIAARMTSFGLIDVGRETIVDPFGRQGIAMIFDFPEVNLFKMDQVTWITRVIESESFDIPGICINSASGDKKQFNPKSITASITDPPYYDAIPYADLSDFFYVWLKRTLGDIYPLNFATPQTPKSDECTALRHYHNGSLNDAKLHFENKLVRIFDAIQYQTSDMVSIMFAHQSTEAWTTLCNSILGAGMNITGSWANDTETITALKTNKGFLSSSVTVCAKPVQSIGVGSFKEVKKSIEMTVSKEVDILFSLGFRGADLLTACFGQAVSEFGKYEKVEKADGSEVTVAELLELARESAFNALLKGFDGDDFTKFYIGWLQLYGFAESDFDDAAKFSRVGLSINVQELFTEHILIKEGNKQTLGNFEQRMNANANIGLKADASLLDQVHRAMFLYKGTNRAALLNYISKVATNQDASFWRVLSSLCEVLPAGCEDHKQALGLLTNKDSLIRESKATDIVHPSQGDLFEITT